jgi:hypothetical protein
MKIGIQHKPRPSSFCHTPIANKRKNSGAMI